MYSILKKILKRLRNILVTLVTIPLSLIEIPLFLLIHKKMFKNAIIYPFWTWSFGHSMSSFDYAARLYYPHRISLIFFPHPRSNKFLPFCFEDTIDVFTYRSIIPPQPNHVDKIRFYMTRFLLLFLSAFTDEWHIISRNNIYKTISLAHGKLLVGREETGTLQKDIDYTGYLRLLHEHIGKNPRMPERMVERATKAIRKKYPNFFSKPFVTILMRTQSINSVEFGDSMRGAGPHVNYKKAIRYLTEHGLNVAGTQETDHHHFKDISGYFAFEKSPRDDDALINLFLLTHCTFYISQHSGSLILPSSCGILCLSTDSLPHRVGTHNPENIILHKNLRDRTTGKLLPLTDIFKHHTDLVHGYHFKQKNIEIEPNTSEEIFEAVKECKEIVENKLILTEEDKELIEKFQKLPSPATHLYYEGNRPPLFVLRKLRNDKLL